MTVGLAQYLTIKDPSGIVQSKWQNYWINQTVDGYSFAPFSVASLISKVSSGQESINIQLPPTRDNLNLIELGLLIFYTAKVDQYQFLPPASGLPATKTKIASFTGEFQAATFNISSVTLTIGSNLDSTESQSPPRTFTSTLIGFPPKL
jgi:hypothetical protein